MRTERQREIDRAYYQANRERLIAAQKARDTLRKDAIKATKKACYDANPEKYREHKRVYRLKQRKLTRESYDAMVEAQQGRCAICQSEDPRASRWQVDHCHETNITRALLCRPCNTLIGLAREDAWILERAAAYVETCNGIRNDIQR